MKHIHCLCIYVGGIGKSPAFSCFFMADRILKLHKADVYGKKNVMESNLTGRSDHKFLDGQVMVSSQAPGT